MKGEFLKSARVLDAPDADEVNVDIDGERLFEGGGLFPALVVVAGVHPVCEWDLLVVARWEETNLQDHDAYIG